ncbi:MAG: flagellar export chaperone FliS [Sulfuriferula sp.]
MFGSAQKGVNAYAKVELETGVLAASPHKLITMLFDGAKIAIDKAILHTQNKEIAAKGRAISHAISIVNDGLRASLNKEAGGEIAMSLDALYGYMVMRLIEANLHNDIAKLNEVNQLMSELRGAWVAIDKTNVRLNVATPPIPFQHDALTPRKMSFVEA